MANTDSTESAKGDLFVTHEVSIHRGTVEKPPRMTQIPIGGFGRIISGQYNGTAVFRVSQDRFVMLNYPIMDREADEFDEVAASHHEVQIAEPGDTLTIIVRGRR